MLISGRLISVGYSPLFDCSTITITVGPGGHDYEVIVSDEKAKEFAKMLYSQVSAELSDPIVMQVQPVTFGRAIE